EVFERGNEMLDCLFEEDVVFPEGVVRINEQRVPGHPKSPAQILHQLRMFREGFFSKCVRAPVPSGGGQKFVALDARRNAAPAVVRLDAQHTRVAANIYVACEGNLLRQGEDKLDRAAGFRRGFDQEIKPAEADVARLPLLFGDAVAPGKPDLQGQHHRKPPCGATIRSSVHASPDVLRSPSYHPARAGATAFARARRECGAKASPLTSVCPPITMR